MGTLARYGLDYATLSAQNPGLVYCSLTGFGQSGPYAARPGYDAIFQAMGGLMSSIGYPDEHPAGGPMRTGLSITDVITSLYADVAIIAALHARADNGGKGDYIDIALLDSTVAAMSHYAMHYLISGQMLPRRGNAGNGGVPSQVFRCRDGAIMLTEQQRALIDQVKRFAQREVLPLEHAARHDPDYGSRLLALLGSAGMLGLNIPEEYGGIGLPQLDAAMCIEEMARHSLDAAGFMAAASLGQAYYIYAFGTEAHRRRYLPDICAGKYTVAIGITEPGAGTASTALTTRGTTTPDGITLNGRKHYVSNVPQAGVFIVYCRLNDAPRAKGIGAVLVDRDTTGFTIDRLSENMAGHFQADLLFEDCTVPAENLLAGAGYLKDLGVERRYRYVRGYSIAGGPLDIHRTMIAGWLVNRRFSQWADAAVQ